MPAKRHIQLQAIFENLEIKGRMAVMEKDRALRETVGLILPARR